MVLKSLIFYSLIISPAIADELATGPDALEHWRRSTIAIGEIIEGKFITIGSGVIVTADGGKSTCILTARHVFFDPPHGWTPTSVRIRLPVNARTSDEDTGVKIELNNSENVFWKGAAGNADLATIRSPDLSQYWDVHAVSTNDFGKDDDVFQGANILTLGYPMIPGPDYLTSPIGRGGIIAWVDPIDGWNKPFLIDSNIVHGNSGGPVFHIKSGMTRNGGVLVGNGMAFIGIVSKNATEEAPVHVGTDPALRINQATGKVEQYSASVENIGGIGIIEPVSRARELVEQSCRP
jgi:hypothetical protein